MQSSFSLTAGSPKTLRTPPPMEKGPTHHGDWAARDAHSKEEVDAFTTHDRAQAFLSASSPRTPPTPNDFMKRGDDAWLTPKPSRTDVSGLPDGWVNITRATDDTAEDTDASSGLGRPSSDPHYHTPRGQRSSARATFQVSPHDAETSLLQLFTDFNHFPRAGCRRRS